MSIVMATSVHIPPPLLLAVDRKARALKISRNRLIVQALEREVRPGSDWSADFLARLAAPAPGTDSAVEEMLQAIRESRSSKKPIRW